MPIKIDGSLLDPSRPAIAFIKMQQLLNLETGKQFAIKIYRLLGLALKHDKGRNVAHGMLPSRAIWY
ncbi:hypothetical protein D3C78_1692360 [compost metagenome]